MIGQTQDNTPHKYHVSPAVERHLQDLRERHTGKPQAFNSTFNDAQVVELFFAGKTLQQSADILKCSPTAVRARLMRIGLPLRNCHLYRGHPFTSQDIRDFAADLGMPVKTACSRLRVSEGAMRHGFSAQRAAQLAAAMRQIIDKCCYRAGERDPRPVRDFLSSEILNIQQNLPVLAKGVSALRIGIAPGNEPKAILNWICAQSRLEEAKNKQTERTFRTLLYFWPALQEALQKYQSLLSPEKRAYRTWSRPRSSQTPKHAASNILAVVFGAAPYRVREAATGKLLPLQPQTMRMILASAVPQRELAAGHKAVPSARGRTQDAALAAKRRALADPIMIEKGFSLVDLAKEAGLDYHTVDNFMEGFRTYRSTLKKLAGALGVRPADLP